MCAETVWLRLNLLVYAEIGASSTLVKYAVCVRMRKYDKPISICENDLKRECRVSIKVNLCALAHKSLMMSNGVGRDTSLADAYMLQ